MYSTPPIVQHVPHKVRWNLKHGRKRIRPHLPRKVHPGIRMERDPNSCNAKQHGFRKRIQATRSRGKPGKRILVDPRSCTRGTARKLYPGVPSETRKLYPGSHAEARNLYPGSWSSVLMMLTMGHVRNPRLSGISISASQCPVTPQEIYIQELPKLDEDHPNTFPRLLEVRVACCLPLAPNSKNRSIQQGCEKDRFSCCTFTLTQLGRH